MEKDELDTHLLVWFWPITVPIGLVMLVGAYTVYGWLKLGNYLIDKTINNPKL